MSNLRLIDGYRDKQLVEEPPPMGFRKMAHLALRTWPFLRPMLKHLLILGGLAGSGILILFVGALIGTDLMLNKVAVGEKLQPLQAAVLFVGDEYVTTDPERLGKRAASKGAKGAVQVDEAAAAALADIEPQLTPEQRRTVRNRLLIWTVLGGVFGGLIGGAMAYYNSWVWQNINQNLRVAMIARAETLSLRFYDANKVGDGIFRVYQDSAMIVNLIQSGIIYPILGVYSLFFGLAVVAAFDPWFALMAIFVAMPVAALFVWATPRVRRRALVNRLASSQLTSRLQESFAAIKVVKANSAERRVFDQFDRDSRHALDAAYFLRLDMALATMGVMVLGGGMLILSEYVMVSWVIDNRETFLGALVASWIGFVAWNTGSFVIARGRVEGIGAGAHSLLGMWLRMQDLFIALERAFFLLDQEPEVDDPAQPVPFPRPIESVSWRNVTFGYSDEPVLRSLGLEAKAGTVTAIVGATGSGKSTLMTLLLRLYDPQKGDVFVNDVNLRDIGLDDLRGHCAIALQKNVLFADTVANNIAFGWKAQVANRCRQRR